MAVNADGNWLGQERVDVPHLRLIESGVRYDFDSLAYILVGEQPMVIKGFELLSNPVGFEASLLTFKVAGSKVIHPLASESGSIFSVPTARANEVINPNINTRVLSSIQPNSVNFIGIDLQRSPDASTADVVQLLDPSLNQESPQKVPLRRTLDYVWIVSAVDFTFNRSVCPVAIVTTNALNVVTAFQDARPLMGRLTPGGAVSTEVNPFGWPGGRSDVTLSSTNPIVGDKALRSFKDIINAIETRLWELGGGDSWYSPTADRNVNLLTGSSVFTSSGESFEIVSGNLHWKGLKISYDNSLQHVTSIVDQITDVPGLTDLIDGECIYIDLDRTSGSSIHAQKALLSFLGLGAKPGSRWVIASRIGSNYYVNGIPYPIGSSFSLATTSHSGTLKTNLDVASPNPIAATIVPSGAFFDYAAGVVTGRGLSNNRDIGSVRTFDTNSDLLIGRGTAAGDNNVQIHTDTTTTGTVVTGSGDVNHPYLAVNPNGSGITTFNSTPLDLVSSRYEGTKSWRIEAINVLPFIPSAGSLKYFYKREKTFKTDCRLLLDDPGPFAYNDTTKTLTATSHYVVSIDSTVIGLGDRIFVNNLSSGLYNGIYVVSQLGISDPGGQPAILTRAFDCCGPLSATVLNLGYDAFDGTSVRITAGTTYSGTSWVLNAPRVAGSVVLNGTVSVIWSQITPSDKNADQFCVMWFDGSYTPITTSPEYSLT
jgi:hypothetical protein